MTEQELADEIYEAMWSTQDSDTTFADFAKVAANRVFDLIASGELAARSTTTPEDAK